MYMLVLHYPESDVMDVMYTEDGMFVTVQNDSVFVDPTLDTVCGVPDGWVSAEIVAGGPLDTDPPLVWSSELGWVA